MREAKEQYGLRGHVPVTPAIDHAASSMRKIRINELARELEVKPGTVIDLLPQLGVTEKKTHSSSLDDDVADALRRLVKGGGVPPPSPAPLPPPAAETREPHAPAPELKAAPVHKPVHHAPAPVPSLPVTSVLTAPAPSQKEAHEGPVDVAVAAAPAPPRSMPIRPPLASLGAPRPAPPALPVKPAPRPAAPVAPKPAPPVKAAPAAPAAPSAPLARNLPIAARPAPGGPRPGQIIASGPRAPLPEGGVPRPPSLAPGVPRPPVTPGAPQQQQQRPANAGMPTRPPLVGQPAVRPVVPPRPDLVARLTQTQPRVAPGQPAAPRPGPGAPRATPGAPVPGQPIYQGFRSRPGGGPGAPGGYRPGGPGGPGGYGGRPPLRGRGPHPTTAPLPSEPPPVGDAARRTDARRRAALRTREDVEGKLKYGPRKSEPAPLPVIDREITISEGITVKELSEKLGVKASLLIRKLVDRKIFATINQTLDTKLAEELAREFGASTAKMSYEAEASQVVEQTEVAGDLETRPPVVTIMGHVDHGKTSLLDAIRETNVAGREAGGITQHIGAYAVETKGRKIVFIDTPGHEAFTRMRARGSKVTDIVILVVAADDGVMPQTREAIDHARAAKVPIIVAVNKIDKNNAQPERVKQQLTELGLMPEDWGGDTPFVPVSAKLNQNLDLLLEMILLVADMQELKSNPARTAVATVLEAQLDKGRGPVATLLIRNGTLRIGDFYLCGSVFGKVRALFDDRGKAIKEATPSMPVEVLGLESMPDVGDTLQVVTDLAKAKQVVQYREVKAREVAMAKTRITLEMIHAQLREGETKELNVIIKADVGGTAEVLSDTLQKLSTEKISIRVLSTGVGAINESDVLLASTSEAIIIGFNVRPERNAAALADQDGVDIRLHTIIYELTDEVKKAMTGMLDPVFKEVYKGRAEVREVFRISKVGTVAGCQVQDGVITRESQVRLLRDNVVVHTGRLDSLKRFKNDASEVKSGFECGIALASYNDIKPGDIIEAFATEKVTAEAIA